MGSVSDKGNRLVGSSRSMYACNELVNEILTGSKNSSFQAKKYLTWGVPALGPGEGVVVVGLDGAHVGIFVNDREFVHSSVEKWQVIKRGMDQLRYAFPNGWIYRKAY